MKAGKNYTISIKTAVGISYTVYRRWKDGDSKTIQMPVWMVDREAGKPQKTIYATCPRKECLRINKLDRRKISDDGFFSRPGRFNCTKCNSAFFPYLEDWKPELLVWKNGVKSAKE